MLSSPGSQSQAASVLDVLGSYRGPCIVCDRGLDARHREADVIVERWHAGETSADLACDYGLTVLDVFRICQEWPRGTA